METVTHGMSDLKVNRTASCACAVRDDVHRAAHVANNASW
jgi:hypothetical protein